MRQGDLKAEIEGLYRVHRSAIARRIRSLTQDPAAVDDLVNETFLRAYRSFSNFDRRSSVSTWLHGIAVNVSRTYLEKGRRRARLDVRFARAQTPSNETPLEDAVLARAAVDRLRRAIRSLPDPLREAFVLRVVEQRAWHEVSKQLSVALSTVHGRVARAEALLREQVEDQIND